MNTIDRSALEAITHQLRDSVSRINSTHSNEQLEPATGNSGVDFGKALSTQLQHIQHTEQQAEQVGQRFTLGDDSVNLSDVMIASQKATIELQTAIQVRNKLVSAYHDLMNMQI